MGGKKASGKHYTSKGERKSSISTRVSDPGQRLLNQLRALNKGKNVVNHFARDFQDSEQRGQACYQNGLRLKSTVKSGSRSGWDHLKR